MAVWIGGSSGSLSLGANYDTGSVPTAGQDLTFDHRAVRAPTQNMNALQAVNLATIEAKETYIYDIGTTSQYLETAATTAFKWYGKGTCYFKADGGTTPKLLIESDGSIYVQTDAGAITRVHALRGRAYINNALNITAIYVGYENDPFSDVHIEFGDTGGGSTTYIQYGGRAIVKDGGSQPGTTTFVLAGGDFDYRNSLAGMSATTYIQTGGTLRFTQLGGGLNVTNAYLINGAFDTESPNNAMTLTAITQSTRFPQFDITDLRRYATSGTAIVVGE